MAKQTGLLEVIFKITVKNVMGESSGCLPVAVHMSLILLMKTILIVRLTSLWTSRIFTQKPCRYELSGTAVLSRFCTVSHHCSAGRGKVALVAQSFAQIVLTPYLRHILSPLAQLLCFSLTQFITGPQNLKVQL